jgi:hypothetical protein
MKSKTVRTTLSLDEDVAAKLKAEARKTGKPFRAVVNETIRKGLVAAKAPQQEPFEVWSAPLGLRPGLSYDSISELLEIAEGPYHR